MDCECVRRIPENDQLSISNGEYLGVIRRLIGKVSRTRTIMVRGCVIFLRDYAIAWLTDHLDKHCPGLLRHKGFRGGSWGIRFTPSSVFNRRVKPNRSIEIAPIRRFGTKIMTVAAPLTYAHAVGAQVLLHRHHPDHSINRAASHRSAAYRHVPTRNAPKRYFILQETPLRIQSHRPYRSGVSRG